jgi:hypothetical protein
MTCPLCNLTTTQGTHTHFDCKAEIKRIQAELDFHPDASPFWETPRGQDTLESAAKLRMKAKNTNKDRLEAYAWAKRNAAYPNPRRYVA